eukprot:GHVU01028266.1.p1 GENE.GHVU01028266.1~~GHVU01028266.1.p1  ORF type:complete len:123 (+),score=2.42 GHVU01028266.1:471-839(+)
MKQKSTHIHSKIRVMQQQSTQCNYYAQEECRNYLLHSMTQCSVMSMHYHQIQSKETQYPAAYKTKAMSYVYKYGRVRFHREIDRINTHYNCINNLKTCRGIIKSLKNCCIKDNVPQRGNITV